MSALLVGLIQSLAIKLFTQKFFEAMLVIGLKKLAALPHTPVTMEVVKEVAKNLGREDLVRD